MKKFINILLMIALLFTYENVSAKTDSQPWCTDEGELYEISYNNEYVGKGDLNLDNIKNGFVKGHNEDINYKIERVFTGKSCSKTESGLVVTCPESTSDVTVFNNGGRYYKDNLLSNGLIKITYDMGTNNFKVKFAKELADKYYIRKVPTMNENNDKNSRNFNAYSKEYYPDNQFLGSNLTFTISVGSEVIFEYYEKESKICNGTFLHDQFYKMDNMSEVLVDNPALTNPDSYIYKMCDKYVRNNPNYLNDEASIYIKKAIVPICYKRDIKENENPENALKIYLNEYNNLDANKVINSTKKLDEFLLGMSALENENNPDNLNNNSSNNCSSGNGSFKCDEYSSRNEKSSSFNAYANGDFAVSCTDTYKFKGDTPKLTYAGGGFEYGSGLDYSLVRKCSIRFIGSPAVKPLQCTGRECTPSGYFIGNLSGNHFPSGSNMGPNEDFDSCIIKCDGGKYSQTCINSCYKEVYGEDTKRNDLLEKMSALNFDYSDKKATNLLNYNDKSFKILKVGQTCFGNSCINHPSGTSVVGTGPVNMESGRVGDGYNLVDNSGNVLGSGAVSRDYCQIYGGETTWSCYDVPSGCVWNAEEIYQARLSEIRGNHSAAVGAMNNIATNLSAGNVNFLIVDSYLKNSDGKFYNFSINNYNSNLRLKLETYHPDKGGASGGSATIGQRGETVSLAGKNGSIGVNGVKIDANAYIGKTYGDVVYNKDNRSFTINKNNAGNYGINTMNSFDTSDYYNGNHKNGNPQYFTSLFTDNKNVKIDGEGKVSLNLDCYNIELSVTGLGTSNKNYSFSNSCYYGVYNNYIVKPDPPCNDPNGRCPSTKDEGKVGGIRYIFRPIELTDVFPDREPRWNWTNSASLNLNGNDPYLGYNVNPEKTTEHIEDVGHTILADANLELDYEIILDRGGIAKIKIYNKEMKSYTNFTYNCDTRGINLCKTDFLDFGGYIKNQRYTRIKDLSTKNGWEW